MWSQWPERWRSDTLDSLTQFSHKEKINLKYNICRIFKSGQINKNLSQKAFCKVIKVPLNATIHKTRWFLKGVWGWCAATSTEIQPQWGWWKHLWNSRCEHEGKDGMFYDPDNVSGNRSHCDGEVWTHHLIEGGSTVYPQGLLGKEVSRESLMWGEFGLVKRKTSALSGVRLPTLIITVTQPKNFTVFTRWTLISFHQFVWKAEKHIFSCAFRTIWTALTPSNETRASFFLFILQKTRRRNLVQRVDWLKPAAAFMRCFQVLHDKTRIVSIFPPQCQNATITSTVLHKVEWHRLLRVTAEGRLSQSQRRNKVHVLPAADCGSKQTRRGSDASAFPFSQTDFKVIVSC